MVNERNIIELGESGMDWGFFAMTGSQCHVLTPPPPLPFPLSPFPCLCSPIVKCISTMVKVHPSHHKAHSRLCCFAFL